MPDRLRPACAAVAGSRKKCAMMASDREMGVPDTLSTSALWNP